MRICHKICIAWRCSHRCHSINFRIIQYINKKIKWTLSKKVFCGTAFVRFMSLFWSRGLVRHSATTCWPITQAWHTHSVWFYGWWSSSYPTRHKRCCQTRRRHGHRSMQLWQRKIPGAGGDAFYASRRTEYACAGSNDYLRSGPSGAMTIKEPGLPSFCRSRLFCVKGWRSFIAWGRYSRYCKGVRPMAFLETVQNKLAKVRVGLTILAFPPPKEKDILSDVLFFWWARRDLKDSYQPRDKVHIVSRNDDPFTARRPDLGAKIAILCSKCVGVNLLDHSFNSQP